MSGKLYVKDILKTFYYDTEKIKPNNEAQKKRKVVINTASKLYDKLLNIYTTQYDKLSEDSKERVNVLNRPEMLNLDRDEDLPQEGDEEVKLEPEETFAERIKLNSRKIKGIGLKNSTPTKLLTRFPILLV